MAKSKKSTVFNSVTPANTLLSGVFSNQPAAYGGAPLSQPYQLSNDSNYTPITLNRVLLSYSYMTFGIIQTFIDQPVEDALRGGLVFKSNELSPEDIETLTECMDRDGYYNAIKKTMKWAKLYGGAGLIINTDQDPTTPLDLDAIDEDTPLQFFDADRWELVLQYMLGEDIECPYNYYGEKLHKSRVIKIMGKEAPSFIRQRLQGWGMSDIERVIRPINSYVKNEDLVYQLLDEAKLDVWRIDGFNRNILSSAAQGQVNQRLLIANMMKNFHRAIVMDKMDEYEQKQLSFGGLAEILQQNRIGIAAALRMPMTKIFGLSASGFNSGEDDIENYNSMIESEVRSQLREIFYTILPIICRKKFGFIPESLKFEFKPLRVMSSEQEENVKTAKFNRYSMLFSQGMLNGEEYADILKAENLQTMETEVGEGLKEPETPEGSATFDTPQKPPTSKVTEA